MFNLNRRDVLVGGGALATVVTATSGNAQPLDLDAIYRKALVIDTLCPDAHTVDPREALDAGMSAVVLDIRAEPRDTENARAALAAWSAVFQQPNSAYFPILKAADFATAKASGKLGIVLACQNASILGTPSVSNTDSNVTNLRTFFQNGLRVLQLTYTVSNGLGSGYSDVYDEGLSRTGLVVLEEMNRLGMLIDTSHCSENTTLDAIKRSTKPIAVTHAGCYSLYPNKRNKSDKVIRGLAKKGGYLGIYNMTLWMTKRSTASVEDIADHIDHAVRVGGIDLVGFGSDHEILGDSAAQAEKVVIMQRFADRNIGWPAGEKVNGQVTASDMDGPKRMQVLARALSRRRYRAAAIEKILGGNFARVFGEVCG